jgi:hypothetical protein
LDFGQPGLENSKIAQFNWYVVGQTVSDFVQGALDNVEDLVLHHAGLIAYRNDDVAFRKFCHSSKQESFATAHSRAYSKKKSKLFGLSRLDRVLHQISAL